MKFPQFSDSAPTCANAAAERQCPFLGGTGNLPVPPGYQPGGMRGNVHLHSGIHLPNERLSRSGRLVADRHRQVACATQLQEKTLIESAFTMVEIAISLAVIGFALVAIIGILPIGMNVQKDNREQTIINFDSSYLMDAIRSGVDASYVQNPAGRVLGIDVLTNYVLAITNVSTLYDANGNRLGKPQTRYYTASNYCFDGGTQVASPALTNGLVILGLLTQPKYIYNPANSPAGSYYSNSVVADIRAITGSQMDQGSSAASKEFAFTYRVTVEVVPSAGFPARRALRRADSIWCEGWRLARAEVLYSRAGRALFF